MPQDILKPADVFANRHIGPNDSEIREMLTFLGFSSLEALVDKTVPKNIRTQKKLKLPGPLTENEALTELRAMALENKIFRNYIGMGYSDTVTPPVILRNVMENPGWYTQYTPYQAEIAQGRLEALLNFQTLISDMTGMQIANASMLDEGTAAAEAMSMALNVTHGKGSFFVSHNCHPQTIEVVKTRAHALGIEVVVGDHARFDFSIPVFGVLVQYPGSDGAIYDYEKFFKQVHEHKALAITACDLLSLALLKAPGEFGADIVVGNSQRFGVPLGYGGPHAAFFATREEYKRSMPGRIVGVSVDASGKPALRLALQTREQHIRRAKATSNICTAQVLLAVMASMYAVYHGPGGIKKIARRVHGMTSMLAEGLKNLGYELRHKNYFDTLAVKVKPEVFEKIWQRAQAQLINFRTIDETTVGISIDETSSRQDLDDILSCFDLNEKNIQINESDVGESQLTAALGAQARSSAFLTHPVFNTHHSETEMLRYMAKLQNKDLSLTTSMIPLGSCTMKLNATAEMIPVTWAEFSKIHPFVPLDQTQGYKLLIEKLETVLAEITGFDAISLQPNAGSQGEYAGLLCIKKYHAANGQGERDICLIPNSAHGTNPASAAMASMQIIGVETDLNGNINVADLKAKAELHREKLAALMITYPSTHGVFEESIVDICETIHKSGGQVYMDGANMNAQVGLCRPGDFGADVCHLNLHKTFCIPHGGGGPGMGPIGVKSHLAAFLPSSAVITMGGKKSIGSISAAPWGSPSILPISLAYILMMGEAGLTKATQVAILNANYVAKRLNDSYPVLYKGSAGLVAHECIVDLRPLKERSGVSVDDVAKRLMDYGYHAPTVSWPVAGTMMIEPTESESKRELDRFCDALIAIRAEAEEVAQGAQPRENNILSNAPHTAQSLMNEKWDRPYTRERAAFPSSFTRETKFWPPVSRIDNPYGDRNLVCACPPMSEY